MKKILSLMLASAIIVGSVGLNSFADEPEPSDPPWTIYVPAKQDLSSFATAGNVVLQQFGTSEQKTEFLNAEKATITYSLRLPESNHYQLGDFITVPRIDKAKSLTTLNATIDDKPLSLAYEDDPNLQYFLFRVDTDEALGLLRAGGNIEFTQQATIYTEPDFNDEDGIEEFVYEYIIGGNIEGRFEYKIQTSNFNTQLSVNVVDNENKPLNGVSVIATNSDFNDLSFSLETVNGKVNFSRFIPSGFYEITLPEKVNENMTIQKTSENVNGDNVISVFIDETETVKTFVYAKPPVPIVENKKDKPKYDTKNSSFTSYSPVRPDPVKESEKKNDGKSESTKKENIVNSKMVTIDFYGKITDSQGKERQSKVVFSNGKKVLLPVTILKDLNFNIGWDNANKILYIDNLNKRSNENVGVSIYMLSNETLVTLTKDIENVKGRIIDDRLYIDFDKIKEILDLNIQKENEQFKINVLTNEIKNND